MRGKAEQDTPYDFSLGTPPAPANDAKATPLAYDIVYNPLETMLVKKARANGATAESGMAMLVWQAVVSHEHWDGSVYDKGDIAQLCIDSAKELEKNF